MPITGCNLFCKEIHFEWKRSSGWLESWEVLPLFAFRIWQQMVRGVIIVSSIIIIVIMIIINIKFLFSSMCVSQQELTLMLSQSVETLMCRQKHCKVSKNELWDFWRSVLQTSEQGSHQEKLQKDEPSKRQGSQNYQQTQGQFW